MYALMLLHGGPYGRVVVGEQGKGLLLAGVLQRGVRSVVAVGRRNKIGQFPIV